MSLRQRQEGDSTHIWVRPPISPLRTPWKVSELFVLPAALLSQCWENKFAPLPIGPCYVILIHSSAFTLLMNNKSHGALLQKPSVNPFSKCTRQNIHIVFYIRLFPQREKSNNVSEKLISYLFILFIWTDSSKKPQKYVKVKSSDSCFTVIPPTPNFPVTLLAKLQSSFPHVEKTQQILPADYVTLNSHVKKTK